ncbi:MAG: SRPBCC domain-containing protein [Flavobacteriales bacterium]|nr:SRPBCC domain-containing protein [Flavobacteriales bacterium]
MSDHEVRTTRIIAAPCGRVFAAWTDPAQLAHWWGPNGFTNTFHRFRPKTHASVHARVPCTIIVAHKGMVFHELATSTHEDTGCVVTTRAWTLASEIGRSMGNSMNLN